MKCKYIDGLDRYKRRYFTTSPYSGMAHVKDIPIMVLDTETRSPWWYLIEVLGLDENSTEKQVRRAFNQLQSEQRMVQEEKLRAYLERNGFRPPMEQRRSIQKLLRRFKPGNMPFSSWAIQIVCAISVTRLVMTVDYTDPENTIVRDITFCGVETYGRVKATAEEMLRKFHDEIVAVKPTIVGWNTLGYDIPVLCNLLATPAYGLDVPRYLQKLRSRMLKGGYFGRHLDLMMLHSLGTKFAKLDYVAKQYGFPGKLGTDGGEVIKHFLEGDFSAIRDYCETDTLNTAGPFLVLLRNGIIPGVSLADNATYNRCIQQMLDYLDSEKVKRPHLGEFLDAWIKNSGGRNRILLPT